MSDFRYKILDDTLLNRLAWRHRLLLLVLGAAGFLLLARAVQLQLVDADFYAKQGDVRQQRTVVINAHRGDIVDRNGEMLALSTPMIALWVDPAHFSPNNKQWEALAAYLNESETDLKARLMILKGKRSFVYLKRQMPPQDAARIEALNIKGLMTQKEYRRYYPAGEVAGHVLGFTNIDDKGQEGLELAFNQWLVGEAGKKEVMRDRYNRPFQDLRLIKPAQEGKVLQISMDKRIQYLAYRALKEAVAEHKARSGSVVVLDARTSEVLAMVNQPSFNPNSRKNLSGHLYRNRAVTDVFEPGSTMKPFTVSAGLMSGAVTRQTKINTSPGRVKVGEYWVKDVKNYGSITPAGVIKHSSNVGASYIATSMDVNDYRSLLNQFGFGHVAGSGLPGESPGFLPASSQISEFEQATMSYGYGLSVSTLQLAQAYAVIANDGQLKPVSFLKGGASEVPAVRVISADVAKQVRKMMEAVTQAGGTAPKASIAGYRVAGKTGTVHKASRSGGYEEKRYFSLFAGMVPAESPRLVAVVMINDPKGQYFGGQVAAPVFADVISGALRLMNVSPDNVEQNPILVVRDKSSRHQQGGRT